MGNHEYCDQCGMNSFHPGECPPTQLAKHQAEKNAREFCNQQARDKAKKLAVKITESLGVKTRIDKYGHIIIDWYQFR